MFVSPFLLNLYLPVKKETQNIALSQWQYYEYWWSFRSTINVCEGRSVMSDCLWPQGLLSPWNSPGQNTGMGSLSLLQGIFPTQGSNRGLPHCRQILHQLSLLGTPKILKWVAYPFSSRSSRPSNQTGVSCISGGFFINWTARKKPHKCILWCICKSVNDGAYHLLAVETILAFYFSKYKPWWK